MPFLAVQQSASYITNSAVLQSDGDGLPVYRSLGPSSLREEIGQTSSIQLILCKLFDNRTQHSYNSSDGLALLPQHLCCAKFFCPSKLKQTQTLVKVISQHECSVSIFSCLLLWFFQLIFCSYVEIKIMFERMGNK